MTTQPQPERPDLAVFLLSCIEDDERVARGLLAPTGNVGLQPIPHYYDTHRYCMAPARVLADVEAKRRIVELHAPRHGQGCWECMEYGTVATGGPLCPTLRLLAQPYRGQPGWDEGWSL